MGLFDIALRVVWAVVSTAMITVSAMWAVVQGMYEFLELAGILVLGIVGLGWSIYSAGRDRRVKTYEQQEQLHRDLLIQTELDLSECRKCRARLIQENERLLVRIAHLEEEMKISGEHA